MKLKDMLKALGGAVSLRDLTCFGGLACIGYGVGQVHEPAAWTVVGLLLFLISVGRVNGPS